MLTSKLQHINIIGQPLTEHIHDSEQINVLPHLNRQLLGALSITFSMQEILFGSHFDAIYYSNSYVGNI